MHKESIGKIIKDLRKANNISQQQLSEILGLNHSTISKWENDIIMPDLSYLKIISEKFDIPLEKLIEGEIKRKKSKQPFILSLVIFIELIAIILLAINYHQVKTVETYNLASNNDNVLINGIGVIHKEAALLKIYHIEYINKNNGTINQTLPEIVTIVVSLDNKTITNQYIENDDHKTLNEILSNIDLQCSINASEISKIKVLIKTNNQEITFQIKLKNK